MEGLDLVNRVASIDVDEEKFYVPMEPDFYHEELAYKSGTGTEYFTSATSAEESEPTTKVSDTQYELILMISNEKDEGKLFGIEDGANCTESEGVKFGNSINSYLSHLSKRQANSIKSLLNNS